MKVSTNTKGELTNDSLVLAVWRPLCVLLLGELGDLFKMKGTGKFSDPRLPISICAVNLEKGPTSLMKTQRYPRYLLKILLSYGRTKDSWSSAMWQWWFFSLQGPCLCLGSELVVVQLAFPGTKENSSLWILQESELVITSSLGQEYCGLGCQLLAHELLLKNTFFTSFITDSELAAPWYPSKSRQR